MEEEKEEWEIDIFLNDHNSMNYKWSQLKLYPQHRNMYMYQKMNDSSLIAIFDKIPCTIVGQILEQLFKKIQS